MRNKFKKYIFLFYFFIFLVLSNASFSHEGCCSWHSGVDQCDVDSQKLLCNDGTLSPTCTCDEDDGDNSEDVQNED